MDLYEMIFGEKWVLFRNFINGSSRGNLFGEILCFINFVVMSFFALIYFHQTILALISIITKPKKFAETEVRHSYGYIIAARNEEMVIAALIRSILSQNYPKEKMRIFVVADNCTDKTAEIARKEGAIAYERSDTQLKGKSYALDYIFKKIHEDGLDKDLDAYFIFDADNLLDANYTLEMNKTYEAGCKVVASYRNSTNMGQNIWTFGTGYCFLREADLLHRARTKIGKSSYISGTGFLVDKDIIIENGGWIHHTMIEDIEFSLTYVLKKGKIMYCHDAIFYDEQPANLKDSWNQRMRWVKGLYQCFFTYFGKAIKELFKFHKKRDRFDLYEAILFSTPTVTFTLLWLTLFNILMAINWIAGGCNFIYFMQTSLSSVADFLISVYAAATFMCLLISIKNWKRIKCRAWKKIVFPFFFFFFLLSYVPMLLIAPFKKVQWKQIKHYGFSDK